MIEEIAPAKVNLFLHVGPVRRDGLHALESLFVFAEDGDIVRAAPAPDLQLAVTGPEAGALSPFPIESNLVWRAACALRQAAGVRAGAALTLDKRLPVAAGVGGGSADAAAALRALRRLWRLDIGDDALRNIAFRLGADVPACLDKRPVFVSGAGEIMRAGPSLPPLWLLLVNPRAAMPTGPVFRAFDRRHPAPPAPAPALAVSIRGYDSLANYLSKTKNDLEPFAVQRESSIATVIETIKNAPGSIAARMSGSGATAFGLFSSRAACERAGRRAAASGWWVMASMIAQGRNRARSAP